MRKSKCEFTFDCKNDEHDFYEFLDKFQKKSNINLFDQNQTLKDPEEPERREISNIENLIEVFAESNKEIPWNINPKTFFKDATNKFIAKRFESTSALLFVDFFKRGTTKELILFLKKMLNEARKNNEQAAIFVKTFFTTFNILIKRQNLEMNALEKFANDFSVLIETIFTLQPELALEETWHKNLPQDLKPDPLSRQLLDAYTTTLIKKSRKTLPIKIRELKQKIETKKHSLFNAFKKRMSPIEDSVNLIEYDKTVTDQAAH